MKLGITGHRDIVLEHDRLVDILIHSIYELGATEVLSGMAIGYDLASAEAALRIKVPVRAICPFDDWTELWEDKHKEIASRILGHPSTTLVMVTEKLERGTLKPFSELYRRRNQYIVDSSDALLCGWSGDRKSGTGMTVNMARKASLPIFRVWGPNWEIEPI